MPRLRPGAAVLEPVLVCIPARDEAHRLPDLLADLQRQRGVPRLRVLVLDDASADGTGELARRTTARDDRFEVLTGSGEPPPGWTGKAAACARLAEHARPTEVLVFLDADVRLTDQAIAAAVARLRRRGTGLVAPWPRQDARTPAERLVQPLLAWSWSVSLPIRPANRSRRRSTAVACGQFLVFDPTAYRRVGGHAAVAGSVTEDLDLARALRDAGVSTELVAANGLASCRMYRDAAELTRGYSRWLWSAYPGPAHAAVTALLTLTYLVPPLAALTGAGPTRRWGVAGYTAAVGSRLLARRLEGAGWDPAAALHPVSVLAYLLLGARSRRAARTGRLTWRGRPLPARRRTAARASRGSR
ncbi:glycosyltransferase [Skermania piniformis]|uniref:Glycosyltransferase n=2 Tax=Skermania pinensis TaxID=39122 RepID=A0ABX8SEZ4_9ACTN|nr:glycosyltransferase [Skermania piniformis]QXQ15732.1 glycosyltransferase [Skermania piniformis]